MLAALTAAKAQTRGESAEWDKLEHDVATLSYESALRTHARHSGARKADEPPLQAAMAGAHRTPKSPASRGRIAPSPVATNVDRSRKRASVTVRLTEAELAQLHARAAEAGLTVSAYLRSCTFEVEALRAQVKQMVAELRQTQAKPPERETQPRRRWLWVSPRRSQRSASA